MNQNSKIDEIVNRIWTLNMKQVSSKTIVQMQKGKEIFSIDHPSRYRVHQEICF